MEESWFGFLIVGGLCSKPGRSLCERIKLTFATAPGCLHSLSLGRHDRFGRLCNQFLPKTLRFSLQRHKSCKKCSFLRLFAVFLWRDLAGVLWGLYWLWYCGFFCSLQGQTVLEKNSRNKKNNLF